ncbi:hypothetical protein E2C01_049562 [Portunus trituberculatus]|uniref:Uncharacterized protein n=1 Tax=Portunus trituberculatus TaxID=210409 RepID=A0A5B7GDH0_PORTR|nr:hypothetical protein [Portunus trituberculatus]
MSLKLRVCFLSFDSLFSDALRSRALLFPDQHVIIIRADQDARHPNLADVDCGLLHIQSPKSSLIVQ